MERKELSEEQLDRLLATARHTWRVPPRGPDGGIWDRIEAAHFGPARVGRRRLTLSWRTLTVGIAAALVIGIGVGRWSARVSAGRATVATASRPDSAAALSSTPSPLAPSAPGPVSQVTTEYLGETAALLAALPRSAPTGGAGAGGGSDTRFAVQAAELLTTTRLLLDSPAAQDPQLHSLLEDLELVLAQIARLPAQRGREELDLIREALEQRDVVPRLRVVAAAFTAGDD